MRTVLFNPISNLLSTTANPR